MLAFRRLFSIFSRPPAPEPPVQPIFWTLQSIYLARALYVAAELGIADLIAQQALTCGELARVTETHEPSLRRVLRALAAFGIFSENAHGKFEMTATAASLRCDSIGTLRDWTILTGAKPTWDAFGEALNVVKTGQCGFELAHGEREDLYTYCRRDRQFSETFVRAQSNWTDWQRDAILNAFDFGKYPTVVDVGGGRGSMISGILARFPNSKGILLDQPSTIEMAQPRVDEAGVAERCRLVPGSFLEEIPEGGDAYIIKHVLRDWDDAACGKILGNCHQSMGRESTLLLIDAVVDPRNLQDRIVKLLDLEQMFWLRGTLRTLDEWEHLLSEAGFRLQACHRTAIVDAVIMQAVKK